MGNRVYVIDDDVALLRLSKLILDMDGFEVDGFSSSREALAMLADDNVPNPDALVLDLNMPDLNGWEFYRRARDIGYQNPVLILSAHQAERARQELGAEAAISKPFEPEELSSTLRSFMSGG